MSHNLQTQQTLGFTLIEILVAFSLIAVLSGIGFITFSSYSSTQIVQQTAEEFKQTVNIARFNAVSNVTEHCPSGNQLNYYAVDVCVNDNPDCSDIPVITDNKGYKLRVSCGEALDTTVVTKELPDGVEFSTEGFDPGDTVCGDDIVFGSVDTESQIVPCKIFIVGFDTKIQASINGGGFVTLE